MEMPYEPTSEFACGVQVINHVWLKLTYGTRQKCIQKNIHEYYSYILCYVDDILVIQYESLAILKRIDSYFNLKPTSIGDPDIYLGSKVKKMKLENGTWCWSLNPSKYVQEAVQNCEQALKGTYGVSYKLPRSAPNPFPMGYRPEMMCPN